MSKRAGSVAQSAKVQLEEQEGRLVLQVAGMLDERVKFKSVLAELAPHFGASARLGIDLSEVRSVSSVGLREWLLFLGDLQGQIEFAFIRINETIVLQSSIVPGILGPPGTVVESFEIPYRCRSCKSRTSILIGCKELNSREGFVPPAVSCGKCREPLEFDAMESEYFAFLSR